MQLENEKNAVAQLADRIAMAGAALFKSTKYVYSMCEQDFYNCDIKDVFRIILNNVYQVEALEALGLTAEGPLCGPMNSPEYAKVFALMVHSFAVRLPLLKTVESSGEALTDQQIKMVYDLLLEKGAVNHANAIAQTFEEMRASVKRGRDIPPYETEWYRTYLYQHVPALAQVSNQNVFLLGVADLLFTMFYMRLESELEEEIRRLGAAEQRQRQH